MPADEYAREMLNAFDAPVEGAYYTEAMNALQQQKRVGIVPVNLSTTLDLWLGHWNSRFYVHLGVPDRRQGVAFRRLY